jgi:hypothetical protein
MILRAPLVALLLVWPLLAAAQTPVYESKDKSGPVFSDQPSPGAKPLDLPAPNVIALPKPSSSPPAPASTASAAGYSKLAIVAPASQGTIHTNTGAFTLQLQARPALRVQNSEAILIGLDGTRLAQRYTTTTIAIKEADWMRAAAAGVAEHSLQAAIVDRNGVVLIESAPVRFFVQRATVGARVTPHAP